MKIITDRLVDGSYVAYDEDTYDGAPDSDNILGFGDTEKEAIEDFKEELEYEKEL